MPTCSLWSLSVRARSTITASTPNSSKQSSSSAPARPGGRQGSREGVLRGPHPGAREAALSRAQPLGNQSFFWGKSILGKSPEFVFASHRGNYPISLPLSASDGSRKTSGRTGGDLSPAQQKGRGTGDLTSTAGPGSQRDALPAEIVSCRTTAPRGRPLEQMLATEPRLFCPSFLHPPEDKPEPARMEGGVTPARREHLHSVM